MFTNDWFLKYFGCGTNNALLTDNNNITSNSIYRYTYHKYKTVLS